MGPTHVGFTDKTIFGVVHLSEIEFAIGQLWVILLAIDESSLLLSDRCKPEKEGGRWHGRGTRWLHSVLTVTSQCLPCSVQVGWLPLGRRGRAFSENVLAVIGSDTQ